MLQLSYQKQLLEAGCDEAGRGCLAGPVCAAAVILPKNFKLPKLNDSKQLAHKVRDQLRIEIEARALSWAVAMVWEKEIDEINILNASILAMHRALDQLTKHPEFIAVDGNRFKAYSNIPHQTVIKGDGKLMNIAAASILAKTHRDEYMSKLHLQLPHYQWNKNKGYPTTVHRAAIIKYGSCEHHRTSFALLPKTQTD
ncbi:MAG: ribonuclease HII [Bacteroidia bacterium]|jgi:ribonuclease HII